MFELEYKLQVSCDWARFLAIWSPINESFSRIEYRLTQALPKAQLHLPWSLHGPCFFAAPRMRLAALAQEPVSDFAPRLLCQIHWLSAFDAQSPKFRLEIHEFLLAILATDNLIVTILC